MVVVVVDILVGKLPGTGCRKRLGRIKVVQALFCREYVLYCSNRMTVALDFF